MENFFGDRIPPELVRCDLTTVSSAASCALRSTVLLQDKFYFSWLCAMMEEPCLDGRWERESTESLEIHFWREVVQRGNDDLE